MKNSTYIKLCLFITLLIIEKAIFSQIVDHHVLDTYKNTIKEIFSDIDTSKLSTGILIERAPAIIDIAQFDINSEISSTCNVWNWLDLHNQLYLAHNNPEPNTMNKSLFQEYPSRFTTSVPIPLGILYYDYNRINNQAVKNGYIVVDEYNKKVRDISGSLITPYDTNTCFAASFLTDRIFTLGSYDFCYHPNYFISNKSDLLSEIYIDFDDGQGFSQIVPGNFTVIFSTPGTKKITVRINQGNETYHAYTSLTVVENSNTTRSGTSPDFGPEPFTRHNINAEYGIWYGCNNNQMKIRKPYLIVSGFDPNDVNRLWGSSCVDSNNLYQVSNKEGFLDKLRDDGFDIIIYRSKNSTHSIISNAMNLVEFIKKINSEKTTNCELIIAGASMGGLVVRYALTYMESINIDHQTKLFISVDSPQEGATVPLGMQALVVCLNYDFSGILTVINMLRDAKENMLDAEAAKEMLVYHYTGLQNNSVSTTPERTTFLNALSNIGYFPEKCRSVAISMGSGTGTGQGFAAGQSLLRKHWGSLGGIFINAALGSAVMWAFEVWAAPNSTHKKIYEEDITLYPLYLPMPIPLASREIYVNNTVAIDNAPGSKQGLHNLQFFDNNTMATMLQVLGSITMEPSYDCFIPSYSALGLSYGNNPHTNIKTSLNNNSHVHRLTNNMYMSLDEQSPSYFDFMYIENNNDFHIYDPATREGVFSSEMLSTMRGFSSPDHLYLDGINITNGKSVDHYARHCIVAGNGVEDYPIEGGGVKAQWGGSLNLYAGNHIFLKPGFQTKMGSKAKIMIKDDQYCPNGTFNTPQNVISVLPGFMDEEQKKWSNGEGETNQNWNDNQQDNSLFDMVKNLEEPVLFFPNPTTGIINISSNKSDNQAFIYDINGSLIDQISFNRNFSLDMTDYVSGIYIIKVIQETGAIYSGKIVKQ